MNEIAWQGLYNPAAAQLQQSHYYGQYYGRSSSSSSLGGGGPYYLGSIPAQRISAASYLYYPTQMEGAPFTPFPNPAPAPAPVPGFYPTTPILSPSSATAATATRHQPSSSTTGT